MELLFQPAYWLALLEGVPVTLGLTATAVILGTLIAMPVAFMRLSDVPAIRTCGTLYVFVFRGVPVLLLLFFIYYGLPQFRSLRGTLFWDLVLAHPFACAALAIALSNGGYMGEVLRGGFRDVPKGEVEAAQAIGMTRAQVMFRVKAPHAIRLALFAYGNEVIFTLKATALASTVTVHDLMGQAGLIQERGSDQFTPLIGAALLYILLIQVIEALLRLADRRMNPARTRREQALRQTKPA